MELSGKNKTNAFLYIFCTYRVTLSSVSACDQTSSINKTKIYINKKSPNTLDSILLPTSVLRNMYKGQNLYSLKKDFTTLLIASMHIFIDSNLFTTGFKGITKIIRRGNPR